jgi:hypothetical protein
MVELKGIGSRSLPKKLFWSNFGHSFGMQDHFREIKSPSSKNKTLQLTKIGESKYNSIKFYSIGSRSLPHKTFWAILLTPLASWTVLGKIIKNFKNIKQLSLKVYRIGIKNLPKDFWSLLAPSFGKVDRFKAIESHF